mmetsp:Transcript_8087/g.19225  ORF Transcript_8087/g.19225 Transcript_8087/m.19225 type:complete len:81 (+) Transcript_8087:65-307(+)
MPEADCCGAFVFPIQGLLEKAHEQQVLASQLMIPVYGSTPMKVRSLNLKMCCLFPPCPTVAASSSDIFTEINELVFPSMK